jgi:murein DD-endopeptidase MepM/ murein hydrolase activator NlpD
LLFGCPVAAVALLLPARGPLLVGAFAKASAKQVEIARLAYRAGGGIVTGTDATMSQDGCTSAGASGARVSLSSVSLLAGAVTADRVTLTRGGLITAAVSGLKVGGSPAAAGTDTNIPVPGVGYLTTGADVRLPVSKTAVAAGALALHLTSAQAGLPPGTVIVVAAIGLPTTGRKPTRSGTTTNAGTNRRSAAKPVSKASTGQPLKVTPPLAFHDYDFPVAGQSDYIDTYGAFRTDVPGNWHHGDDIFAALGTPVVAVANGTINRVGWEKLGGWRLWVRDDAGDEFYYAHLSGYAPHDLHSDQVRAGEVIGFVGNTGDAFTTSPHLHFEVHPRQLLHLGYNGAVDPTTYLNGWTHLDHVNAPRPVDPPLPRAPALRSEARYVFRELLAARHLISHAPSPTLRPDVSIPAGANGIAPTEAQIEHESAPATHQAARAHGSPAPGTTYLWLGALAALLGITGIAIVFRRGGSGA